MRIVSLLAPTRSGVYQFHCNLARGLAERGCLVTWLCSGSAHATRIAAENAEQSDGEVVAPYADKIGDRTRALVDRISEISPDALICHARSDPVDFNAIRYLTNLIPKVLVLHGSTLAVYRAARTVRDCVNATVAASPRIQQDLASAYGFSHDRLRLIPHGIDISAYSARPLDGGKAGHLRILSHGRIDRNKGIFWIPEILAGLSRHSSAWNCTISGDGPDLAELRRRIAGAGLSERVRFSGWTAAADVPALMNGHDAFLFPTKYEGFPIALIEAMASGCVPVVSRLAGITDCIIVGGVNGFLFPIGNVRQATLHLLELLSDKSLLTEMRNNAKEEVKGYGLSQMGERYYKLICDIQAVPRQIRQPEHLGKYKLASGLKPAWWYGLPDPIKNHLRIIREKMRASMQLP